MEHTRDAERYRFHDGRVRKLPGGTVTMLFTDIDGSTRLLAALGDAYGPELAEHRRRLRVACSRHGGVEVDSQGDSCFFAFPRARDALIAALEGQDALEATPIRVRMGIHTGEPRQSDDGYVGMDVHMAARVMGAGHGGQVLVSQATRAVVGDEFELRDLGLHRLRDVADPIRILQLGAGDFPPLRTLSATNLPAEADALVGRQHEIAELAELVTAGRVVTVTGPGGSGKTRLAVSAAHEALGGFRDGVFWIPLAGVADAGLVLSAIAQSVGARDDLASFLAPRRSLLLLDNFEHVLEAAGDVAQLLSAAPHVRLLITSRSPLRIGGEREYVLDPLRDEEAAGLFVERARAVGRSIAADPTVLEICRRLDRLPLAIELAAARTKLLAPAALLSRLDRRLPLLTGGRRDVPARQRTVRATIEWSHDLLDAPARLLFARLSAFAGGFSFEAAAAVADAELETLGALVDASLVKSTHGGRFAMLETIREFAGEQLDVHGGEETRQRHAQFFLGVAKATNLAADAEGEDRYDLAHEEAPDLRAAIDWAAAAGEKSLALEIAVELEQFWVVVSRLEGERRFRELLTSSDDIPRRLLARALRAYGGCSDSDEQAERAYVQSLAIWEELGDERQASHVMHRLGHVALQHDQVDRARELAERGLELDRKSGNRRDEAIALGLLGDIAVREGDDVTAARLFAETLDAARAAGFTWWTAATLLDLAAAERRLGRLAEAAGHARQALELAIPLGDRAGIVMSLAGLARIAAVTGEAGQAGTLWGAVEGEERRSGLRWARDRAGWESEVVIANDDVFDRGREVGRRLSLEEAAVRALTDVPARLDPALAGHDAVDEDHA